jgi:hypothetical protein
MHAADQPYQDLWPGIPNRCSVVIAETFSRSGKSLAVLPLNSMSVRSRRTLSTSTRRVRDSTPLASSLPSRPSHRVTEIAASPVDLALFGGSPRRG